MNDQACFRLFDLPGELVEEISFFFHPYEAHKLLTVSSTFHKLFAKRVWWILDPRIFTLSEPTRSTAIQRYGKLVRLVDLGDEICSAIKPEINKGVSVYDTLSVFFGVTTLSIRDRNDLLVRNGIQYKDIIMCFPNLYNFECSLEGDKEPHDLVTLALAINHRHNDCNMNPIEYLSLSYFGTSIDNPWTQLSNFVQTVVSNSTMKIEIHPYFNITTPPSQSELEFVSKYFRNSPTIQTREGAQICYATINRHLYSRSLTSFYSHGHSHLRQLSLRTCCASSDTYDYCDITPISLPYLQSIWFNDHECDNMVTKSYSPAWKKVLLQTWPHLNDLTLNASFKCEQFVDILEHYSKITRLHIWLGSTTLNENNTFNLATILPLLPKLERLVIFGQNTIKIDFSPGYDDRDILARSQINTTHFFNLTLSTRVLKLIYSLPKLERLVFSLCHFYSTGDTEVTIMDNPNSAPNEIEVTSDGDDEDEDNLYEDLMAVLDTISVKYLFKNPCGIKEFELTISGYEYVWPLDVTVEMMALMPELQYFIFDGETVDILNAVKARLPYIKAFRRRI